MFGSFLYLAASIFGCIYLRLYLYLVVYTFDCIYIWPLITFSDIYTWVFLYLLVSLLSCIYIGCSCFYIWLYLYWLFMFFFYLVVSILAVHVFLYLVVSILSVHVFFIFGCIYLFRWCHIPDPGKWQPRCHLRLKLRIIHAYFPFHLCLRYVPVMKAVIYVMSTWTGKLFFYIPNTQTKAVTCMYKLVPDLELFVVYLVL